MRISMLAVVVSLLSGAVPASAGAPDVGSPAPEVTLTDLDGKPVRLSELRGKVVVLDIWATWCPPCRGMIPHEREMVARLKDKPFMLVSISLDAKKETLQEFLKKEPMPWTHIWNGQGVGIAKDWEVRSIPSIYVLDDKGVVRYKNVRGQQMEDAALTLLKGMGGARPAGNPAVSVTTGNAADTAAASAAVFKERASNYLRENKLDSALADYNEAIRFDPTDAQAYRARAGIQLHKGNYAAAVEDSSRAIRLDPNAGFQRARGGLLLPGQV